MRKLTTRPALTILEPPEPSAARSSAASSAPPLTPIDLFVFGRGRPFSIARLPVEKIWIHHLYLVFLFDLLQQRLALRIRRGLRKICVVVDVSPRIIPLRDQTGRNVR